MHSPRCTIFSTPSHTRVALGGDAMQDSLSGRCSAALIVTLRTEAQNIDETIGTLRFAQRAKAIPVKLVPSTSGNRRDDQASRGL